MLSIKLNFLSYINKKCQTNLELRKAKKKLININNINLLIHSLNIPAIYTLPPIQEILNMKLQRHEGWVEYYANTNPQSIKIGYKFCVYWNAAPTKYKTKIKTNQ